MDKIHKELEGKKFITNSGVFGIVDHVIGIHHYQYIGDKYEKTYVFRSKNGVPHFLNKVTIL